MKGEQRALDRQTYTHQRDGHHQRYMVFSLGHNMYDLLMDVAHQQMAGKSIEKHQSHQQQTGTQKAHDHVPGGRLYGPAPLADHDQTAGRNGIDLHKHVGSKHIIGIDESQKRTHQQIDHNIVQLQFLRLHLFLHLMLPAHQGEQHDNAEEQRHDRLQRSDPQLIAPGSRECSHHINVALPGSVNIKQNHG